MIPELVLILAAAPRYRALHIQTENTQLGFALRETGSDSAKKPLTVQIFEHNKKARRTGMVRLALQMATVDKNDTVSFGFKWFHSKMKP